MLADCTAPHAPSSIRTPARRPASKSRKFVGYPQVTQTSRVWVLGLSCGQPNQLSIASCRTCIGFLQSGGRPVRTRTNQSRPHESHGEGRYVLAWLFQRRGRCELGALPSVKATSMAALARIVRLLHGLVDFCMAWAIEVPRRREFVLVVWSLLLGICVRCMLWARTIVFGCRCCCQLLRERAWDEPHAVLVGNCGKAAGIQLSRLSAWLSTPLPCLFGVSRVRVFITRLRYLDGGVVCRRFGLEIQHRA